MPPVSKATQMPNSIYIASNVVYKYSPSRVFGGGGAKVCVVSLKWCSVVGG